MSVTFFPIILFVVHFIYIQKKKKKYCKNKMKNTKKKKMEKKNLFACWCCDAMIGMVSVMSVSRYVMSTSGNQSRSFMYIQGLIPQNWPRQFRLPATYVFCGEIKLNSNLDACLKLGNT